MMRLHEMKIEFVTAHDFNGQHLNRSTEKVFDRILTFVYEENIELKSKLEPDFKSETCEWNEWKQNKRKLTLVDAETLMRAKKR